MENFIKSARDARELKRGLAVKMSFSGMSLKETAAKLGVCKSFVGKWRKIFKQKGSKGLKVAYKGSTGYLSAKDRKETILWLKRKKYWNLESLIDFVRSRFGVIYKSRQSYYDLFKEAGISWKKTQKCNSRKDPLEILKKRKDLKKKPFAKGKE